MTYEDIDLMIADIADTLKCGYSFYTNDEAKVVKTPFLLLTILTAMIYLLTM